MDSVYVQNIMTFIAEVIVNISGALKGLTADERLPFYILAFLLVFSLITGLYLCIRRFQNLTGMLITVLFGGLGLFLFLAAPRAGIVFTRTAGDPAVVTDAFFKAVCAGNRDEVKKYTAAGNFSYGISDASVNEAFSYYAERLADGYTYKLSAKPLTDGLTAVQAVHFKYYAPEKTIEPLKASTMKKLDEIVQLRPKDQIYDENKKYLPGITDEAYKRALKDVAGKSNEDYFDTAELKVRLEYEDGEWKIIPDKELKRALNGGLDDIEGFVTNIRSEALSEVEYIPKLYELDEYVLEGNKPDETKFGSTDNPMEVQKVIDDAWELLGDQKMSWNPSVKPIAGNPIQYYCDDTILVVAWRQNINGEHCACAEIKVADASQIRRKLSMDTFGSPVEKTATALAREANAVFAINGDYYKFRGNGICVYQRQVHRAELKTTESMYIDEEGNMLFSDRNQFESKEEVEKFVKDNDILFGLSFGPVLIRDGEIQDIGGYPLGQVNENYSRSSIGQIDDLHYFCMTINYTTTNPAGGRIADSAQIMNDFGCKNAYALDGGQTAELVMNGKMFNHVDWGNERLVSDIIYFATAVPEKKEQ